MKEWNDENRKCTRTTANDDLLPDEWDTSISKMIITKFHIPNLTEC
jgi:hypothetical protein